MQKHVFGDAKESTLEPSRPQVCTIETFGLLAFGGVARGCRGSCRFLWFKKTQGSKGPKTWISGTCSWVMEAYLVGMDF